MVLNKKGSVRDVGLAMIALFAVGLISFILLFVYNSASGIITEADGIKGTAAEEVFDAGSTNLQKTDIINFSILIGFFIGVIGLGWLVGGIPVFMVLYIIFLIVVGAASALLTYVWDTITGQVIFGSTIDQLPLTNFIVGNLTLFIVLMGFAGLIAMYVRGQAVE